MMLDGAFNLANDSSCGTSAQVAEPRMDPLQYNGGKTWSQVPAFDSPAVDGADPANCVAEDQRGVAPPLDADADGQAACDIGAYEALLWVFLPSVQGD